MFFLLTAAYSLDCRHKVPFADDGESVETVERNEEVDKKSAFLPLLLGEKVTGKVIDGRRSAVQPHLLQPSNVTSCENTKFHVFVVLLVKNKKSGLFSK